MKKYLLVFLALGSLFALTACPDKDAVETPTGDAVETPAGDAVEMDQSTEGGSGH